MQRRSGMAPALLLTAALAAGCAFGQAKSDAGARLEASSNAGGVRGPDPALETVALEANEFARIKRAAVFRDHGQYYR